MNYLLIVVFYLTTLLLFFSLGSLFKKKFNFLNKLSNIDITLIGYSIFVILTFHMYFVFNIDSLYIIIILLLIIIIFCSTNIYYLKTSIKSIFASSILFLSFVLIFFIPAIFYGEQFYVFRGNYWDHFNYLSSSLLFNKYNFYDLRSDEVILNYKNFQSINSIIIYRPFINFFQSLYLKFNYLNIFLVSHSFKIFLVFLNFIALVSFLSIFKKIKLYERILISFIFSISFFSLYIFEIDALSHLGSISLFLMSLKYLYLLFEVNKEKTTQSILFLSILTSSLFIVYPEIFCIFLIFAFTYFINQLFKKNKKLNIKVFFISILIFIIFTISSYELNYKFLIIQFNQAINSNVDWWGYFGAFIFGKKSLVLDQSYVDTIINNIQNKNFYELANQFYFDHIRNGYNFILLNIIPSVFGLYYLTLDDAISKSKYIFITLSIGLHLYILLILKKNIQYLIRKNLNFIVANIIIYLFIVTYLIVNQNFWTVIKLYSYILIFIYLFTALNLQKEKINFLMLIMLTIFPIYKFSTFNNGIGIYDSFPSIIDKNYKKNIKWNLDQKQLEKCEIIYSLEKDYFVNRYIEIKTIHNNKTFQNDPFIEKKVKECNVSIIKKSFIVTSIK